MELEYRIELIERNTEEIITLDELRQLLESKKDPKAYIGFEPSGLMHIGQGVICAKKVKEMEEAGFDVTILLADWHAYINDKLGGDFDNITTCGEYVKDCFLALGVDPSKTTFVNASTLIDRKDYWEKVIKIAKSASLSRIKRAMTIMGREENEMELDSSKIMYPAMQVADIFDLNVDVAYSGIDQRRAHMLARDVAEKLNWKKPIAVHTPVLSGLQGKGRMDAIESKMSKSDPESCIFIHDNKEAIKRKINNAFCPKGIEDNPILEICRYILLPTFQAITIGRPEKFGGDLILDFTQLIKVYEAGKLHPLDLKNAVAKYLDEMLEPVRKYFERNPKNYEKMLEILTNK